LIQLDQNTVKPAQAAAYLAAVAAHLRRMTAMVSRLDDSLVEADIKARRLSVSSPLAKALIGKKPGDTVSVPAPGGDRSYEILSVAFF